MVILLTVVLETVDCDPIAPLELENPGVLSGPVPGTDIVVILAIGELSCPVLVLALPGAMRAPPLPAVVVVVVTLVTKSVAVV